MSSRGPRPQARLLLSTALSVAVAAGCAKLLSYDDYHARDETTDALLIADVSESSVEADVSDAAEPAARIPSRPAGPQSASGKGRTLWIGVRRFRLGSGDLSGGL